MKITNIEESGMLIYRCFSPPLSKFIQEHGVLPVKSSIHPNGKHFDIYLLNGVLSELLEEWTANNPKKKKVDK